MTRNEHHTTTARRAGKQRARDKALHDQLLEDPTAKVIVLAPAATTYHLAARLGISRHRFIPLTNDPNVIRGLSDVYVVTIRGQGTTSDDARQALAYLRATGHVREVFIA